MVRIVHGKVKSYWHTQEGTRKLSCLKKFSLISLSILKFSMEMARWHIFSRFVLEFLISVSCYNRLQGDNANCRYVFH
jgi:hypothetical protein